MAMVNLIPLNSFNNFQEHSSGQTAVFTMDTLEMMKSMVMEFSSGKMVKNMRENGEMVSCMAKVN